KLGRRIKEIAAPSKEADGTLLFGTGPANARDLTKEYRYDTAGRLSRTIDELGQSEWFVYDVSGQLKYTINSLGEVTFTDYDAAGRVIQSRRLATRLSATAVAGFGDAIATFTPPAVSNDDAITRSVFDGDGNLRFTLRWTTTAWAVVENRFDLNGNI